MGKHSTSYNPFNQGDPEAIARIVLSLLPTAPEMSAEERAAFDARRAEGEARYLESRHGDLPENCWRVLAQGSMAGWTYDLEIDGSELTLKVDGQIVYDLPRERVVTLAKEEIAARRGFDAAQAAQLRFVWGGSL